MSLDIRKAQKRPVVVEACQLRMDGKNGTALARWCGSHTMNEGDDGTCSIEIPTLEGVVRADPGDWIIKGVKGEFYPCKPDIFDVTYQLSNGFVQASADSNTPTAQDGS